MMMFLMMMFKLTRRTDLGYDTRVYAEFHKALLKHLLREIDHLTSFCPNLSRYLCVSN